MATVQIRSPSAMTHDAIASPGHLIRPLITQATQQPVRRAQAWLHGPKHTHPRRIGAAAPARQRCGVAVPDVEVEAKARRLQKTAAADRARLPVAQASSMSRTLSHQSAGHVQRSAETLRLSSGAPGAGVSRSRWRQRVTPTTSAPTARRRWSVLPLVLGPGHSDGCCRSRVGGGGPGNRRTRLKEPRFSGPVSPASPHCALASFDLATYEAASTASPGSGSQSPQSSPAGAQRARGQ